MGRARLRSLRRKKEKKKTHALLAALVFSVFAAAGLYYVAMHYPRVREMVFIGNRHLKNEELKELLKLRTGDPLFRVPGREFYRRLKGSPWVRDAVVRKELSGRIVVRLSEAMPAAILYRDGRPHLIDREGAILEKMREESALFLPVIREVDPSTNRDTYLEALRLVRFLQDKGLLSYGGSLEISGERPEELTLKIDDIPVKVGVGDFERKLSRLQFVKDEIKRRNMSVEYVDVRFADEIIMKPVKQEPAGSEKAVAKRTDGKKREKKKR